MTSCVVFFASHRRLNGCGGDEFAIILPETAFDGGRDIAERIRLVISQPMKVEELSLTVTISIGIAELDLHNGNLEELLHNADRALYASKNAGRNRISIDQREKA